MSQGRGTDTLRGWWGDRICFKFISSCLSAHLYASRGSTSEITASTVLNVLVSGVAQIHESNLQIET